MSEKSNSHGWVGEPSRAGRPPPRQRTRFSPLPWILRNCLWGLMGRQDWQVYTYLIMRVGPYDCWKISNHEIATALGYSRSDKVVPSMRSLENLGFIRVSHGRTKQKVTVLDAEVAVSRLALEGDFPGDRFDKLREDCERMKLFFPRRATGR